MRKFLFGFLVVAFCLLSGHAWATPLCTASQPVYISSVRQILCVDPATGTVTVLLTDASTSTVFGDIAFGPDGLLYFTDTTGARVLRLDPKITTAATSATLVANIPSGTPTGLSFSSSNGTSNGDLYVNSSAGVWKIAGIASSVSPATPPVDLTTTSPVGPAITAGGNAFDMVSEVEDLFIMDLTNNQILHSAFPFTSAATALTSVPSAGPGIFANFCGDLLVASGTRIKRFSGGTLHDFVRFGGGNTVQYFEVTADNTVLATAGGSVWRVDPVKDSTTGVPSCSAITSASPIRIVSLKGAPGVLSDIANGVALPPTSISITCQFGSASLCLGGTPETQIYNFGLHKLSVTYKQVLLPFSQTFMAVRSRPADISFTGAQFPRNTVPIHFSPFGGFAIQYATLSSCPPNTSPNCGPSPGVQYVASTTGTHDAILFKVSYFTEDFLVDPGAGHASGDTLLTSPTTPVAYTDDVTHDFWFADQTDGGVTDGWSSYVAFNEALMQTATVDLKSPVSSCGTTTTPTCNPQFKLGQNVDFGFTLTPVPPTTTLSLATARLSIALVTPDGTQIVQTIDVFSKNNSNVDNFFKVGSSLNNYTYNWDSSGAKAAGPGLYLATIFSDSFAPPLKVFLTLVK